MIANEAIKLDPIKTHKFKELSHEAQLSSAAFSPCGKYVFATSYDSTVQRWNLADDSKTALKAHHGWVEDLAFHSGGKHLFTVDSWGMLCCWEYAQANPQPKWKLDAAHASWIRDVAVSPDGKYVATVGNDLMVRLWSAADGKKIWESSGHQRHIYCVAFHPDGKSLVSGDLVGVVKQWNTADGKHVRDFDAKLLHNRPEGKIVDGGAVRNLAFSPDGKQFAASGISNYGTSIVKGFPCVLLYDWASGKQIRVLRPKDYEQEYAVKGVFVEGLIFHKDGFLIGAGGNGEREGAMWFWDLKGQDPFFQINPVPGSRALSIHPDGVQLAIPQFLANGRGINGGNGRKATPEEYKPHHGVVRLYKMTAPPEDPKKAEAKS